MKTKVAQWVATKSIALSPPPRHKIAMPATPEVFPQALYNHSPSFGEMQPLGILVQREFPCIEHFILVRAVLSTLHV